MMSSGEMRNIQLYAIGEIRADGDGFKSPWLLDWEQYMKEQKAKPKSPKTIKAAKAPKAPKAPKVIRMKKPKAELRSCSKCSILIRSHNKTLLCAAHYMEFRYQMRHGEPAKCSKCDRGIYRDNKLGLCRVCSAPYYRNRWKARKREERLKLAA